MSPVCVPLKHGSGTVGWLGIYWGPANNGFGGAAGYKDRPAGLRCAARRVGIGHLCGGLHLHGLSGSRRGPSPRRSAVSPCAPSCCRSSSGGPAWPGRSSKVLPPTQGEISLGGGRFGVGALFSLALGRPTELRLENVEVLRPRRGGGVLGGATCAPSSSLVREPPAHRDPRPAPGRVPLAHGADAHALRARLHRRLHVPEPPARGNGSAARPPPRAPARARARRAPDRRPRFQVAIASAAARRPERHLRLSRAGGSS